MRLKTETVGFVRGGMLFLEPPWRWRVWQRDAWRCCTREQFSTLPCSHDVAAASPREGYDGAVCPRCSAFPQGRA